jgi:hypothetical protein
MRINVYAEEMTDRIELVHKEIDGTKFTAVRFYLELPVSVPNAHGTGFALYKGPFMHKPGDDDSAAVTFWGKNDFRHVLQKALDLLDEHYDQAHPSDEIGKGAMA